MKKLNQTLFKGDLVLTFGWIDMGDGNGEQRYMRLIKRRQEMVRQSAAILEKEAWRITDDGWCRRMLPSIARQVYGLSYTKFDVTRIHDAILEALEDLIRLEPPEEDTKQDEAAFLEKLGLSETYRHNAGPAKPDTRIIIPTGGNA